MPLPPNGSPWPPPSNADALARIADYDAWYSGDPDKLGDMYKRRQGGPSDRPSQYRGGVVGKLSRWFWGQPTPTGQRRTKIHMPLPADIATASADLLFAKPPAFLFTNSGNASAWETLDDQMRLTSRLHESAEISSALSGVYLRVNYDTDMWDHPILSAVHPDSALPEFKWGRLTAVTFVRVLERDGSKVVRYLERHEMDTGRAVTWHGVYDGTVDKLGRQIDLGAFPETSGLDEFTVLDMPVLPVVHIPNMLPSRDDRGSDLGRSDYEGVTQLFDALDETATDLMRDIRLGKGRAFIPSAYLQSLGHGQGASWDPDAEIYEQLDIPPTASGAGITLSQFAIRVDEHVRVMEQWARQATQTAGYSASTFGLDKSGGGDMTATEVNDRKSRSDLTRAKKSGYFGEGLRDLAVATLWIARIVFGRSVVPTDVPEIQWPDAAEVDPLKQAQTIQALAGARAISTFLAVKTQHPDWDDAEVTDEVVRINDDNAVEDAGTFTGGTFGQDETEQE